MDGKDTPPFISELAHEWTQLGITQDVSRYRELARTDPSRELRDAFLGQMAVLVVGDVTDVELDHLADALGNPSISPRDLTIFIVIDVTEQRDVLAYEDVDAIVASASYISEANGDAGPEGLVQRRRSEAFLFWETFKDFRLGLCDRRSALDILRDRTKGGEPDDEELCARLTAYGIRPDWLFPDGITPRADPVSFEISLGSVVFVTLTIFRLGKDLRLQRSTRARCPAAWRTLKRKTRTRRRKAGAPRSAAC